MNDELKMYEELDDPFMGPIATGAGSSVRPVQEAEEVFGDPRDLQRAIDAKPRVKEDQSLTSLTRRHLEKMNYIYAHAEAKDAYSGVSHDLLGLFDGIAIPKYIPPGVARCTIGVQTTSVKQMQAHVRSMCSDDRDKRSCSTNIENLKAWLGQGHLAYIIGWERRAKVGNQVWFFEIINVNWELIALTEKRRRK